MDDHLKHDVCFNKGTEPPFSGKYLYTKKDGTYLCTICQSPLFLSNHKYDSGTGWPSFDRPILHSVCHVFDDSHGMVRTEVQCANCGSHLGHVFDDGPTETNRRYCINSVSLRFQQN